MCLRAVILACALALVASGANAQAPTFEKILDRGGEQVTGQDLAEMLSGRTLYGHSFSAKVRFTEYYAPDGRAYFDAGRGVTPGTWSLNNDHACFEIGEPAPGSPNPCSRLFIVGDQIYGIGYDVRGDPAVSFRVESIVDGDPEGLAP